MRRCNPRRCYYDLLMPATGSAVLARRECGDTLTPALSRGERVKKPSPSGRGLGEGVATKPELARRQDDLPVRLRQQATDVERTLWRSLRDRQLTGAKFRRQAPVGPYVVDFLCLEARLIVELDGGQHADEDATRQNWLESQGYRVLRLWNNEVTANLDGVLTTIATALA